MEYWEECHNNQPESTLPAFGEYNDDFSVGGWSTDHKMDSLTTIRFQPSIKLTNFSSEMINGRKELTSSQCRKDGSPMVHYQMIRNTVQENPIGIQMQL